MWRPCWYAHLTTATSSSDHGSFWTVKVGAIEILENMFDQKQPGGCTKPDKNTRYHTSKDTFEHLNPDLAIRIIRASLAAIPAGRIWTAVVLTALNYVVLIGYDYLAVRSIGHPLPSRYRQAERGRAGSK